MNTQTKADWKRIFDLIGVPIEHYQYILDNKRGDLLQELVHAAFVTGALDGVSTYIMEHRQTLSKLFPHGDHENV